MTHLVEDARLVCGVTSHRVEFGVEALPHVPLQVVGLEVQDGGRVHLHRVHPVQLEARQFHGQHVIGGLVEHRLHHRASDVAHGRGLQACSLEDRGEHLRGGGLAIGAGDRQPRDDTVGVLHAPGQLDLAPDRDATGSGLRQQGRTRAPARRGDHQVDVVGKRGRGALAELDLRVEELQDGGLVGVRGVVVLVQDGDLGADLEQAVGGCEAGRSQPGDDDLGLGPVRRPVCRVHPVGCTHCCPTTHSA